MFVITGATGNSGNAVAERLLANGEKVRVIGRDAKRLERFSQKGAEAFVADLTDASGLTKAFAGVKAVYAMIPPDLKSSDYRAHQERVSDAVAAALEKSGVKHVVALSSIGADKSDKVGPVVGLNSFEKKLNAIDGLNVIHLRAGYFMENVLPQVGVIQSFGIVGGPLRPDLLLSMIATRDIGDYAADALRKLEFHGKQTRELLGQRDLRYAEVATIIGKAIDKPGLAYIQLPPSQMKNALVQFGMSENVAGLLLEMSDALNSGYMVPLEKRSPQNTTPTSIEEFVGEKFMPAYRGRAARA